MMNPLEMNRSPLVHKPSYAMPIIVGCGAFFIGIGLTIGYIQWQDQKEQLARMTLILESMQQPAPSESVTRNAPLELLSLAAVKPVTIPAPAALVPTIVTVAAPAPTTADRIRDLVSRSSDPMVSAAISQDVARRETMSVAIQGVNELVDAATAGEYTIDTEGRNADGISGTLRISFPGRDQDQAQLERLLSSAAEAGMIAFNESVKGSDGSFNGHIILFDLIERALSNGTADERRTAERIRKQAVTLLSDNPNTAAAAKNSAGERFYTVEAGDSLAYIALQFYGNTNDYQKIFNANRGQLSSPEKIQIGQKLLIPTA